MHWLATKVQYEKWVMRFFEIGTRNHRKLRKSATIDWQYKDSVRAKMRTLIRIALRTYKYPPDLQSEAIEFVLKQAQEIAEDLVAKETI